MQRIGRVATGLLLLLCACTRVADRPLKVGTNPWAGSEPLYLARELGLYPTQPVHLVEFTSAHQLARAFRNGVIDAAAVPLIEVLRFEHLGQHPRVVLVLDSSHGTDCLLARPELESLPALKGKRVAHADLPSSRALLTRLTDAAGLLPEDLHEVVLSTEAQEAALRKGKVDAVLTSAPACARLMAAGAHPLFDSSQPPDELVDVVIVREEYLAAHPQQVDSLLKGWFAALEHYRTHPDEDAQRMAPRLGLDAEHFQKTLLGMRLADENEQRLHLMGQEPRLRATVERLGAMMLHAQALSVPPDAAGLIDPAPLDRVLAGREEP